MNIEDLAIAAVVNAACDITHADPSALADAATMIRELAERQRLHRSRRIMHAIATLIEAES